MFEEDNGGVATAEPSQPFDVSKLLEQAKAAAQPPQAEQPAFNVDRLLSDAKAVAAGKPTQGERFAAAENWAAQRRGSEKVLGGVGVRDILENSIPFASTKIRFDKNRDYMAAKEAFDKGTATDEQLGKIAEFEYDRQRAAARTGFGQKIAYGLTSAPGIAGEAILGGQALGAAGRALGFGQRAAAAAPSLLSRAATGAAVQAAATPLAPGMYVTQSQERAMQNGGQWTDAKNLAPELIKAGITNAILGQLSGLSGGLSTPARVGIGAVAMPAEQGAADAVLTVGEKALKKAGVSDEWLTDTKYGTFGQLARGETGDGMASLVTQMALGAGFAAAHGNEKPIFPKFKAALDSLAAKGVPPEKAAEVIKQAIAEPKPPEGEKPAEQSGKTTQAEPQTDAIKEFVSLLDNNDELKQAVLSSNVQKPAGPETAQNAPQTADLQKTAPEPVRQPIAQPEPKQAARLGVTNQSQESPLAGVSNDDFNSLAKTLGLTPKKLAEEVKKSPDTYKQIADAIVSNPVKQQAESPIAAAMKNAVGGRLEDISKHLGTEGYTISHGDRHISVTDAKNNRVQLNFDYNTPQSESTTKPASLGMQSGTKAIFQDLTKIVSELRNQGVGIEYTASRAKGEGEQRSRADVYERILKKAGYEMTKNVGDHFEWEPAGEPTKQETANAIHDAIRSGESQSAIAEAIQAGNAAAEETQGSNGQTGERQPTTQTEPARSATEQTGNVQTDQTAAAGSEQPNGNGLSEKEKTLWDRADEFERKALDEIKAKTKGKLFSGFDPTLIVPVAKVFGERIVKGAIKFADFSQALIQKFGDAVKPHIQEIWDRAHAIADELRQSEKTPVLEPDTSKTPGNSNITTDTGVSRKMREGENPPDVTSIKNAVTEKERAARGLPPSAEADPVGHSFPELADKVKAIVQADPQRIPELVQSLLKKPRTVSDLEDAMLLHRQVELQNQYDRIAEDWKTAKAANDSVAAADAENALNASRQQLRDLYDVNRKVGTESGRALNARKMLMAKDYSLAKMTTDYELSVGRKMNANDMAIVQKAYDRIKELESRIADLQKKAEVKPEPKPPTFGKRTEAAKAEVDAAWEALRKATKGKLFSNPAFDPEVINAAAGVAKAYIKLGVAKFSDFVEAVQQKSGHQASEEEKKILQAAWDKAQSERQPDAKPEPHKTQTKEQRRVDAEYRSAVTGWAEQLHKNRESNDSSIRKGVRHLGNTTDFLRAFMLGGDLPPMFRQGLWATLQHPIESTKAFIGSAKAFKSELAAHEVMSDLATRPNAKNGMYQRHMGMDVGDIHGMDEFLHSSWIKKLPGFAHLERWHSAYLSELRANLFDIGEAALSRSGKFTEAEADIIGNAVNVSTGKGELYGAEKIVNGLNKVFLAPKWVVSRFELALGQPLLHGIAEHGLQPRARAYVAKEYARGIAGMAFVYSIGAMLVAKGLATIDKNPLNSGFGDIRIGNTRINPTASLSNAYRLLARLWEGKTSENGQVNPANRGTVLLNEARAKLAPIPSTIWTAKEIRDKETGKSKKGPPPQYPQNWTQLAINQTPLSLQDMVKACGDLGIPKGLAVGVLASLGATVKVYPSK